LAPKNELFEAAKKAMAASRSPYSRLKVGAALRTRDGRIYTGCNIEAASFGLTICAERVAVFSALASGARKFSEIAIVSTAEEPITPCGACRQVLWELCGDMKVSTYNRKGECRSFRLSQLLPFPFDKF
jgi:cytidine deaminase